jgi:hypothetical protein
VVEWWSGAFVCLVLAGRNLELGDATPTFGPPNSGAASPKPLDRLPIRTRDAPKGKIGCFRLGLRRRQPQSNFFNQHFGGWSWGG